MNTIKQPYLLKRVFILVLALSFSTVIFAQDDSIPQDSISQGDTTQQKKEKKARSSYKVSAGVSINDLGLDSADGASSSSGIGYNLGVSYKRGRFFYYEIGARYNNRTFDVTPDNQSTNSLSVSAIDIPLTVGINITSFADRLIGVRVFASAVPSFSLNVDGDELGLEKDDITSSMFYGQGGVGVDIAFFFVEVGYNLGFSNIVKDVDNSKPGQGYVNLGFRF